MVLALHKNIENHWKTIVFWATVHAPQRSALENRTLWGVGGWKTRKPSFLQSFISFVPSRSKEDRISPTTWGIRFTLCFEVSEWTFLSGIRFIRSHGLIWALWGPKPPLEKDVPETRYLTRGVALLGPGVAWGSSGVQCASRVNLIPGYKVHSVQTPKSEVHSERSMLWMNPPPTKVEWGFTSGPRLSCNYSMRGGFILASKDYLLLPGKGPDSQSIPGAYKVQKHNKAFEIHGR